MKHANIAFFVPHIGCPNRCSFCNQNTISGKTHAPHADEVKSVLDEVVQKMSQQELEKSEIAFFGGSFTAIEKSYMLELLQAASEFVEAGKFSGIRISTRPDAIDVDILSLLKKYHVKAIELGAQSMNNDVLFENFRGHTAQQVCDAANLIKSYCFSLGLQMMTGLYRDNNAGAIETANCLINLKPDTVRIYPTVVLKGTYLAELFKRGIYTPPQIEETVLLCADLMDMFEENNIRVIRVGLHDQPEIRENFIGGAYHPALGELIQGERLYRKAMHLFCTNAIEKGNVCVGVNPTIISQLIGQKKKNIHRFEKEGFYVRVISDKNIPPYEIKLI